MGAAPSRETHRRGLFTVPQSAPGGGTGGGGGGGSGNSKKQDVVLIPLTREFFPSPECPLFIQFHKARCDAAVNYYFRQPGNPGDLSTIPNYAKSYRPPGEAEERRRRRAARRQRREEKEANTSNHNNTALSSSSGSDYDENAEEEEEEDGSYPSREALYKGVIDHVEDTLFDTDAEMREAYAWACAHPHTTMGPHGQKQRKVLPVLCAVAFRYDPAKLGPVTTASAESNTNNNNMNSGSGGGAAPGGGGGGNSAYQAAVENGVFVQGSIINIVGCFGFVSMEADVEDAAYRLHQQQQNSLNANNNTTASSSSQHQHRGSGSVYQHDPYHKGNNTSHSLGSQGSNSISNSSPAPLLHTSGAFSDPHSGIGNNNNNNNIIHTITGYPSSLPGLPPPVAAPLSAMVFLTKSAGEQNLGRVTYIAASTYYHQLIHAGVIHRRQSSATAANNTAAAANCSHTSNNAADCMPPGSQHLYNNHSGSNSCTSYYQQQQSQQPMLPSAPTYPAASPIATTPEMFLPPMETFSFSSLLTNIPILSFLYEMKCRWGYLGVLRTGTPTATGSLNSSFASHSNANNATNTTTTPLSTHHHHLQNNNNQLNVSVSVGHNHRAVGGATHSAGGLSMIDHSRGQNITDEMEMWITADHMIHGRISRELASRLCWSLAERPEVMQERVTQLPSEEGGYWRYRGLTDRSRPPPLPGPGRIVSIHPKDVYVMGSDVLPGFDEGDILRFDPERLVWFADHAIPLEGVVLAAMRPFCKKAREADSMDAGWVTTLRVKDDAHNSSHANSLNQMFDFPVGAPSEAEKAAMAADASLTHEHEHVGAFYVYRFERDGVVYHHGTVPDFANPNKRKGNKQQQQQQQQQQQDGNNAQQQPRKASSAATPVAASLPTSSDAAHNNNSKKINNSPGPTASLPTKTTQPQQPSTTTAPNAAGVKQTTASSSTTTSVPVPATIASALFTLLPAPQTTPTPSATAANMSPPPAVQMLDVPLGSSPPMNGSRKGSEAPPTTTAAPPPQPTATSYLPSRVTSTAIDAARRIMRNIYSLAYGAPTRGGDAAAAAGSSAASNMSGSRGVTPVSRSYPLTPQMLPSPVQPLGTPQYPRYHGSAVWPQSPIIPSPGSSVGAFPSVVVGNVNNNNNMGASRSALTPFNSSINNNVINTPLMASSPGDRPPSASAPMLVGGGGSGSMPDNQPQHHVRSHSRVLSRSGGSLQLLDEAFVNNSAPNAAAINNNNNTNTTTQQQQQPSEASQQPAAAAAAADQSGKGSSRRAKRYIDNGSYVWDWRKGSI